MDPSGSQPLHGHLPGPAAAARPPDYGAPEAGAPAESPAHRPGKRSPVVGRFEYIHIYRYAYIHTYIKKKKSMHVYIYMYVRTYVRT